MTESSDDPAKEESDEYMTRALMRALDAEADALDVRTVTRLDRARRKATGRARHARSRFVTPLAGWRVPGLAVAATIVLVALLVTARPPGIAPGGTSMPSTVAGRLAIDALPLLSGAEELEFYESIDFLLWLEDRRA